MNLPRVSGVNSPAFQHPAATQVCLSLLHTTLKFMSKVVQILGKVCAAFFMLVRLPRIGFWIFLDLSNTFSPHLPNVFHNHKNSDSHSIFGMCDCIFQLPEKKRMDWKLNHKKFVSVSL
ncbi:hypothetical protein JHK82_039850 [Glycine max]|nr:hypothetical protein JHK87_039844 [Glycine soja]KAG4963179.1 hypothetical protein JHK86_040047 [Glycine max]KAG4965649.1 hypothetical protein JHK85_040624 [Glycine max]KAG5110627.1 hypothetical protein JHK82_039850 [Glycine max]KAG5121916.1 hypothetical protein JHK84_040256 [Glycine max]